MINCGREGGITCGDISHVSDAFVNEMKAFGMEVSDITYSIGWSQSDGAGFSFTVDLTAWAGTVNPELSELARLLIASEEIENSVTGKVGFSWQNRFEKPCTALRMDVDDLAEVLKIHSGNAILAALEEIDSTLWEWIRDKAHDLYVRLRDELEYQMSDEYSDKRT